MKRIFSALVVIIFTCTSGFSQNWQKEIQQSDYFETYQADNSSIDQLFNKTVNEISLPAPGGEMLNFRLTPNSTMSQGLKKKYPFIQTYDGISENGIKAKIDYSRTNGLHAIIFGFEGDIYLDPEKSKKGTFKVYKASDYRAAKTRPTFVEDEEFMRAQTNQAGISRKNIDYSRTESGSELRTYRIAICADNNYSSFHGGTLENVMAAIVTTMNRVNGVYERDVAVTMELVEDSDSLIFLDASEDPFNGVGASEALNINQTQIDEIIGFDNYDIGHVFTTGSGGLAGLGVVCGGSKARGTTGVGSPIGDPFDIDYVAHEIGHQFGGNHTFNGDEGSCAGGNRNGSTAYEPGSGTTIMAYAGICGSQNIQSNSDAFFHSISLEEMITFTTEAGGNDCPQVTETSNNAPQINMPAGNTVVPLNTPMLLMASATDEDGDSLTYSWEQFDLGPAGSPNEPDGNAPLFRSFLPTTDSYRFFPQIEDILNGEQTIGELLPSYERDLNFRLVVRDNNPVSGGINTGDVSFTVDDNAGPFMVISHNEEGIVLIGGTSTLVEWDPASTDLSPVNCNAVDIILSLDGGMSFTDTLALQTSNDGTEDVLLPADVASENAIIMVKASENIFFNINTAAFTIEQPTEAGFVVLVPDASKDVCVFDDATFDYDLQGVLGFDSPVDFSVANVPAELTVSLSASTLNPGESGVLTVTNIDQTESNAHSFDLIGASGDSKDTVSLSIAVIRGFSENVELVSPEDEGTDISTLPRFNWSSISEADYYNFQLSESPEFETLLIEELNYTDTTYTHSERLNPETTYYWRVEGLKSCEFSTEYTVASFTTTTEIVSRFDMFGLTEVIGTAGGEEVSSRIQVLEDFVIQDINVYGLDITHTWISDLTATLESPDGTTIRLFSGICGDAQNLLLNFDDEALITNNEIPCPPTDSSTVAPTAPLATFIGTGAEGFWTLTVSDGAAADGGSFNGWGLEFVMKEPPIPISPRGLVLTEKADSLELTWDDFSAFEDGFVVEFSEDETNWGEITRLAPDTDSYTEVIPNRTTFYRVAAYNSSGVSEYTITVSIEVEVTDSKPIDSNIRLFPNPGTNEVNIAGVEVSKVEIINLTGKVLLESSSATIETSDLPRGVYIVKVSSDEGIKSFRWIRK